MNAAIPTTRRLRAIRFTAAASLLTIILAAAGAGATPSANAVAGNAASTATVTVSSTAAGSAARNVVDRAGSLVSSDVGESWIPASGAASWVELSWATAPAITSVTLFGASTQQGRISRGTLAFQDGSTLAVGKISADPRYPTTIAFPTKTSRSVRFTIDTVAGAGAVGIAEMAVSTAGSTPVRPANNAAASSGINVPVTSLSACVPPNLVGIQTLTVLCPTTGTVVDGRTSITVAAPNSSLVEAVVWHSPAGGNAATARFTAIPDSSGLAKLSFDAAAVTHGPITVNIRSTPRSGPVQEVNLGLVNAGGSQAKTWMSSVRSPAAAGMTLAFAEEFTAPVSFSRIGDADFASAKPEWYGAQEFGAAIFADPSAGLNNMAVVDDDYLRMSISKRPSTFTDPMGWNRGYVGGMLSSARVGGAGFSAQYGYFEARMMVPAGKGLWPAFWLLPSDNLSVPTPVVAEIDVMENYGQKPIMSCQGTHLHNNGTDTPNTKCGDRFPGTQSGVGWHTYGVKVNPTNIVYYIDGAIVATVPQIAGGDKPMYFMLNLALSNDRWWPVDLAPLGDNASMYIDYVRVYT